MKRVTQKEIADSLNISLKTVQRVFNDSSNVSDDIKERVKKESERVGYTPHRAAQALKRNINKKIALVSADSPSFFWKEIEKGCLLAAKNIEFLGYSVKYYKADHNNRSSYSRLVNKIIKEGVDALALVNHVHMDMLPVMEIINKEQIPYATLNIDLPESDRLCYVGPDYFKQGLLAGNVMHSLLPEGAKLGIINLKDDEKEIIPGGNIMNERYQGFIQYKQKNHRDPYFDFYKVEISDYNSREENNRIIAEFMQKHRGQLDGLFCIPPIQEEIGRSLEILSRDKTEKRDWSPNVLGFDLSPVTKKYLGKGLITAEIHQNPLMQGYSIIKVLEHYLETGEKPEKDKYFIASEVVFPVNMERESILNSILPFGIG